MGRYRGILVLLSAAAAIAMLCAYKLTRTYEPTAGPLSMRRAPVFELLDSRDPSQTVRLKSFVGRHSIVLLFFDGEAGADGDANLLALRSMYATLKTDGIVAFGISTALPQDNRKSFERGGKFPFPLLSDPDFRVHRLWGRFDEQRRVPLQGLFLIDRKGDVAWKAGFPQPSGDVEQVLGELIPAG